MGLGPEITELCGPQCFQFLPALTWMRWYDGRTVVGNHDCLWRLLVYSGEVLLGTICVVFNIITLNGGPIIWLLYRKAEFCYIELSQDSCVFLGLSCLLFHVE